MPRSMLIGVLLLATGCSGAGSSADGGTDAGAGDAGTDGGADGPCDVALLAAGEHGLSVVHDGVLRDFTLWVPAGVDTTLPLPLVLNFHGFSGDNTGHSAYSSYPLLADTEGFLVAHPNGTGGTRGWNARGCCGDADRDDTDDVGFTRAMVANVAEVSCVDAARVYATGFSNGGMFSHRLACEASDLIAAVVPVSGGNLQADAACNPTRPISLLHFHGTGDQVVAFENSTIGFPDIPPMMAEWAARNGCDATPTEISRNGDAHCDSWPNCTDGVEVTLCTIDNAGHTWPGAFGASQDAAATPDGWAFLERFSLP